MAYSIADDENNIARLRGDLNNLRLPRRTIAWQHQNRGISGRNITQRVRVNRRNKRFINTQINTAQNRIDTFRSSLLGGL